MTTSLDKSRIKVVLLEGVHDRAVENFARHGYKTVKRYKKALAGDELKDAIGGATSWASARARGSPGR